jgi:hypothetical protein
MFNILSHKGNAIWGNWYQWEGRGGGKRVKEGDYTANSLYKYCVCKWKMRSVETSFPGMGGGEG